MTDFDEICSLLKIDDPLPFFRQQIISIPKYFDKNPKKKTIINEIFDNKDRKKIIEFFGGTTIRVPRVSLLKIKRDRLFVDFFKIGVRRRDLIEILSSVKNKKPLSDDRRLIPYPSFFFDCEKAVQELFQYGIDCGFKTDFLEKTIFLKDEALLKMFKANLPQKFKRFLK
jgi:hypothetical protein